jgi:hypothetical protein
MTLTDVLLILVPLKSRQTKHNNSLSQVLILNNLFRKTGHIKYNTDSIEIGVLFKRFY